MTRSGTTVWTILVIIGAILLMLGLIYGPDLYRKGESIVAPVMELVKSEEAIKALNAELPFAPPEDGLASEERLLAFLEIRRQLVPAYEAWLTVEKRLERSGEGDFDMAGEVLGQVTDVFDAQIDALREQGMSPVEFRWYEFEVYDGWLDKVEAAQLSGTALASAGEIRELTAGDLEFLEELERRHGRSTALSAMKTHFTDRLALLDEPDAPVLDDVAPENSDLFWRHREAIAGLKLEEHQDLHGRLREGSKGGLKINIHRPENTEESQ